MQVQDVRLLSLCDVREVLRWLFYMIDMCIYRAFLLQSTILNALPSDRMLQMQMLHRSSNVNFFHQFLFWQSTKANNKGTRISQAEFCSDRKTSRMLGNFSTRRSFCGSGLRGVLCFGKLLSRKLSVGRQVVRCIACSVRVLAFAFFQRCGLFRGYVPVQHGLGN